MREIVPPSSIIARLGGDEFGICLMFEPEHPETVEHIAEDLVQASRPPRRACGVGANRDGLDRHQPARA